MSTTKTVIQDTTTETKPYKLLLSLPQAAKYLGVPEGVFRQLAADSSNCITPLYFKWTKQPKFSRQNLEEFVDSLCRTQKLNK